MSTKYNKRLLEKDLRILKKRRDFLFYRAGMSDRDLTYDKQEAAALNRVIRHLQDEGKKI